MTGKYRLMQFSPAQNLMEGDIVRIKKADGSTEIREVTYTHVSDNRTRAERRAKPSSK